MNRITTPFPSVQVSETRVVIDTKAAISRRAKAEYAVKIAKEKLDSAMGQDKQWADISVKRARLLKRTKVVKNRLLKDPAILKLSDELDDARQGLKETTEQLNLFLDAYVDETKQKTILDSAGQLFKIVRDNKLKKGKK